MLPCSWTRALSLLCLVLSSAMAVEGQRQIPLGPEYGHHQQGSAWDVSIANEWNVLGPFPFHAREQHFLSPSFPVNLSQPIDLHKKWPSSYADGGEVGWTTARSQSDGTLAVTFPNIRWEAIRATEGWAGLQHHSLLHTTVTLTPHRDVLQDQGADPPRLLVDLLQGSFFTILPPRDAHEPVAPEPEWYMGNIYAMNRVLPQTVSLPTPPSLTGPTTYDLFVSGDYEIRLFGDPLRSGNKDGVPVLSVKLTAEADPVPAESMVQIIDDYTVACDFVDGWAFGDALGVGVRSLSGWWTVTSAVLATSELTGRLDIELLQNTTIAPTQTRIVPIKINQTLAYGGTYLPITLHLVSREHNTKKVVHTRISVRQLPHWSPSEVPTDGIKATYFYGSSTPTTFVVKPPDEPNEGPPKPPILALHGAGVDVLTMPFWIQAIPRQKHSWIIAPTGLTAWGLDWHGPSSVDAWSCVDALFRILNTREVWRGYELAKDTRVLLLGHSNGGQGAWWNSGRYPDRVVAVIPAAAYLKSQSYVPLIQSRSAHYVDPSLRAILETALTPDDNDLFLSNLAHTPVLAIHGGDDDNVPAWHGREYVSTLKTWNPDARVTFREDPGELHWYTGLFDNADVREYIRTILNSEPASDAASQPDKFTVTVSIPSESGSLHGWRILQLLIPGRLARLSVRLEGTTINVQTTNVAVFSIRRVMGYAAVRGLNIDGVMLSADMTGLEGDGTLCFTYDGSAWVRSPDRPPPAIQRSGRLANILTSSSPLTIVYETHSTASLSAALRLAAALDGYHKLDAVIVDDTEAAKQLGDGSLSKSNAVVLTNGKGTFVESLLSRGDTAFSLDSDDGTLCLRGSCIGAGSAALFLHPHPSVTDASILFLYAQDGSALERGLRLFPIRTGVPIPDWVVTTERADEVGSGGIEGMGVWANNWNWNEVMSSF